MNYTPNANGLNLESTQPPIENVITVVTEKNSLTTSDGNNEWIKFSKNNENANKTNIKKQSSDKSLKFKEKKNKSLIKKNIKSTILQSNTSNNLSLIENSKTNQINNNDNKKLLIKRSRKRSKPIVIASLASEQEQSSNILNQTTSSPDDIIESFKCKKASELEPLNKKLAVDNDFKNVDLQIEQFSQLDLHSSEDDSELFIRFELKA